MDINEIEPKTCINDVEYWRGKCNEYKWMYQSQKEICQGYREIIEEMQERMKKLNIERCTLQQLIRNK